LFWLPKEGRRDLLAGQLGNAHVKLFTDDDESCGQELRVELVEERDDDGDDRDEGQPIDMGDDDALDAFEAQL